MMDWLLSFVIYTIPWYVHALVLGVVAYVIIIVVFGRETANKALLWIIGAAALAGAASRLKQQGYTDRRAEEEKALDKAEDFVEDKRHEIDRLPDDKLDQEIDRWTKH